MRKLLTLAATVAIGLSALTVPAAAEETAAERGYRTLLTVPIGVRLMTEADFDRIWQVWPEPARSRAEKASPGERLQMTLARYGFQLTADRPGNLPQQFTADDKGNVSINCLACHGGPVEGKVTIGLGNSLINLRTFTDDLARYLAANGREPSPPPPKAPPFAEEPTRGLNNAWGAAISFMAMRDRDLNVTEAPQFPVKAPDELDIPVKTPPFWLSKRKTRYYYDAFIGKTHRDIMQFVFEYSVTPQQVAEMEPYFKDIFAWINSVQPPKYPGDIDRMAADRGRLVYLKNCASCHGTYSGEGSYPERVIPLDEIGTDPVRVHDFPVAFKRHLAEGWVGDYGAVALYPDTGGYVAPPLDGIWANAPYLHNGSVPTMWDLLSPDARPAVWLRTDNGYDHTKMGLEVTRFTAVPDGVTPEDRRLYYRTALRGLSNAGHRYPATDLSEQEKTNLIEYLKTL